MCTTGLELSYKSSEMPLEKKNQTNTKKPQPATTSSRCWSVILYCSFASLVFRWGEPEPKQQRKHQFQCKCPQPKWLFTQSLNPFLGYDPKEKKNTSAYHEHLTVLLLVWPQWKMPKVCLCGLFWLCFVLKENNKLLRPWRSLFPSNLWV